MHYVCFTVIIFLYFLLFFGKLVVRLHLKNAYASSFGFQGQGWRQAGGVFEGVVYNTRYSYIGKKITVN